MLADHFQLYGRRVGVPVIQRVSRLVSLAAFLSTLLIYSPNVMVLQVFDAFDVTGMFAEPCLFMVLVCSVVVAAWSYLRGAQTDRAFESPGLSLGFCLLYLLSNGIYAATVVFSLPQPQVLCFVAAVGVGICTVSLCLAWCRALSELDFCAAVLTLGVSSLFATLPGMLIMDLAAPWAFAMFVALVVVGVLWPAARSFHSLQSVQAHIFGIDNAESSRFDTVELSGGLLPNDMAASSGHVDIKAFISVMGIALLGMAISSFAMGVRPVFIFDGSLDAQRTGMLLGGAALVPLGFMRSQKPIFSFIYQVYLPVAAVIAVIVCALSPNLLSSDAMVMVVYAFYCMVTIVAMAAAVVVANAHEFQPAFVFSTLVGTFCLTGLFGILSGACLGDVVTGNAALLVVLTALYGCGMLLAGCIKAWGLLSGSVAVEADAAKLQKDAAETLDERIARIAREVSLSPRETEIIGYVGRGHSSVFVAKTLLISESTVYSHVRNAYRKIGVTTREELIQLLNAPADAPMPARTLS